MDDSRAQPVLERPQSKQVQPSAYTSDPILSSELEQPLHVTVDF